MLFEHGQQQVCTQQQEPQLWLHPQLLQLLSSSSSRNTGTLM